VVTEDQKELHMSGISIRSRATLAAVMVTAMLGAIAPLSNASAQYEGSPAEQARKAREQEAAKAAKEKARNDEIVAKQRAAERAAKEKAEAEKAAAEKAKQKK
jgi:hypothetical protein